MKAYPKRIYIRNKINDIIFETAKDALRLGIKFPEYCISAVAAKKITKVIANNYRRRRKATK